MSKAEERALEKYPAYKSVFDKYEKQRYAYICGYIQAEKDLELTWEDIQLIYNITYEESRNVALNKGGEISEQEFYQEVLKRFNKGRKEK